MEKKYWFKRRSHGYGWTPVTWQGWLSLVMYIVIVLSATLLIEDDSNSQLWQFLGIVFGATITLFVLSMIKGPRPKWRWGWKPGDNPKEDI